MEITEIDSAKSMERCHKFDKKFGQSCSAPICPLDLKRTMLSSEKICMFILNYLEGKKTPFDKEIRETERIWRKNIGESRLRKRLKARERIRTFFKKEVQNIENSKGIGWGD